MTFFNYNINGYDKSVGMFSDAYFKVLTRFGKRSCLLKA